MLKTKKIETKNYRMRLNCGTEKFYDLKHIGMDLFFENIKNHHFIIGIEFDLIYIGFKVVLTSYSKE